MKTAHFEITLILLNYRRRIDSVSYVSYTGLYNEAKIVKKYTFFLTNHLKNECSCYSVDNGPSVSGFW